MLNFRGVTSMFEPMNFRYQQALRLLNEAIDFREKDGSDGMSFSRQLSITEQFAIMCGKS